MPERTTAAGQIYPHLPSADREPVQQRRTPNSVADAMWPQLTLKPPKPAPRPPEEVAREATQFWARVWASADPAPVGFVKVPKSK
jgi:hypothetical protein